MNQIERIEAGSEGDGWEKYVSRESSSVEVIVERETKYAWENQRATYTPGADPAGTIGVIFPWVCGIYRRLMEYLTTSIQQAFELADGFSFPARSPVPPPHPTLP